MRWELASARVLILPTLGGSDAQEAPLALSAEGLRLRPSAKPRAVLPGAHHGLPALPPCGMTPWPPRAAPRTERRSCIDVVLMIPRGQFLWGHVDQLLNWDRRACGRGRLRRTPGVGLMDQPSHFTG